MKTNILICLMLCTVHVGCAPADPVEPVERNNPRETGSDAAVSPTVDASTADAGMSPDASPVGAPLDMSVGTTDADIDPQTTDATGGGTPPDPLPSLTEVEALAVELDTLCETDCAKDAMCNPDTAESSEVCINTYCGYLAELDANALSQTLVDCFEAERDLLLCVTVLSCEDYTQYYYGNEIDAVMFCAAEHTIYDNACSDFFESDTETPSP